MTDFVKAELSQKSNYQGEENIQNASPFFVFK